MLALEDAKTWLAEQLDDVTVMINRLPDGAPDQLVVIQGTGGGGTLIEGAFEHSHLHVRSRAATDAEAETLARSVHAAFCIRGTITMGSTQVLMAEPLSTPSYYGPDPQRRAIYTAVYHLVTPTPVP